MKIVIISATKMNGSFVEESRISCVGILKAYISHCEKVNGMFKSEGMQSSELSHGATTALIHLSVVCALLPCIKWAECSS